MTDAPERVWLARHPYGSLEVVDFPASGEVEYIRADLVIKPKVKPLVWYGKPEGQEQRIGRRGQIAYSVRFSMGSWGYTRQGEGGVVVSYKGGEVFQDEADAINGADIDHERRILEALE